MIRLVVISLVFGIAGALIARPKGRNPLGWFVLCLLVLPIVAIALLPPALARGITKRCPHCSEIIKAQAIRCKYCGTDV